MLVPTKYPSCRGDDNSHKINPHSFFFLQKLIRWAHQIARPSSNSYWDILLSVMNKLTDRQTNDPKVISPFNFFEVGVVNMLLHQNRQNFESTCLSKCLRNAIQVWKYIMPIFMLFTLISDIICKKYICISNVNWFMSDISYKSIFHALS